MDMDIVSLPLDLLLNIIRHLPGRPDALCLAATCTARFRAPVAAAPAATARQPMLAPLAATHRR